MTDSKYKIIPRARNENSDLDDEEYDGEIGDNLNDETITIIPEDKFIIRANNLNEDIMKTPAAILAITMIYFAFSIGLTFYQRQLLKNFHFPFAIVLYHLFVKLAISALIRVVYKCWTGKSRIHIDWMKSFRKLGSVGVAAGIDIGFSNCGLELVTISLYTMIKSTTIIFILFFAILFGLEKKSWSLMMIVVLISTGLFMFTYKAAQFNLLGFSFILIASMSSGVRWTFAQFVMQKTKLGLHNPIDMIYYMQPWMILPLLPLTIAFEGDAVVDLFNTLSQRITDETIYAFAHITIGAVLAFAMEISEFLLLNCTSSLTLSIAGIFKEIFLLILAVVLNGDQMSAMNIVGLAVCLGGISLHVIHKSCSSHTLRKQPLIADNGSTVTTKTYEQNMLMNSPSAAGKQNNIRLSKYTSNKTPLLDDAEDILHSDSDTSYGHNNSDVLFDVLKRRDLRR